MSSFKNIWNRTGAVGKGTKQQDGMSKYVHANESEGKEGLREAWWQILVSPLPPTDLAGTGGTRQVRLS